MPLTNGSESAAWQQVTAATESTSAAGRASWDYKRDFIVYFVRTPGTVSLSQVTWLFWGNENTDADDRGFDGRMKHSWSLKCHWNIFVFYCPSAADGGIQHFCICIASIFAIPGGPGMQISAHSIWNDSFYLLWACSSSQMHPAGDTEQQRICPKYVQVAEV